MSRSVRLLAPGAVAAVLKHCMLFASHAPSSVKVGACHREEQHVYNVISRLRSGCAGERVEMRHDLAVMATVLTLAACVSGQVNQASKPYLSTQIAQNVGAPPISRAVLGSHAVSWHACVAVLVHLRRTVEHMLETAQLALGRVWTCLHMLT